MNSTIKILRYAAIPAQFAAQHQVCVGIQRWPSTRAPLLVYSHELNTLPRRVLAHWCASTGRGRRPRFDKYMAPGSSSRGAALRPKLMSHPPLGEGATAFSHTGVHTPVFQHPPKEPPGACAPARKRGSGAQQRRKVNFRCFADAPHELT